MEESKAKMQKAIESIEREFNSVRSGRANPTILDRVEADFYGTPTPVKNMANVSVSDGRTLVITPYDINSMKEIEKAIIDSDLGVTPNNDGKVLRLVMPPLTEETRKQTVKQLKEISENGKVSIRNARREALDKNKKDSEATEDDKKKFEKDMQKVTDDFVALIDKMMTTKEAEIMTV